MKIGQELSAASLTRGLGGPTKRTNICKIGFGFWDYFTFLALGAGLILTILRGCEIPIVSLLVELASQTSQGLTR